MIYGYSRISTKSKDGKQTHKRQLKALKEFGCDEILIEELSGGKKYSERPILDNLLTNLKEGDKLVIVEFSRISRSLEDLLQIISIVKAKKAFFTSIKENITVGGKEDIFGTFLIHILGAASQFEKDLIRMRVKQGVDIAKEKGLYKGRKETYTKNHSVIKLIPKMLESGQSISEISRDLNISRKTIYRKMEQYPELFQKNEIN